MREILPRTEYEEDIKWSMSDAKKFGTCTWSYRTLYQRVMETPREYLSTGVKVMLDDSGHDTNHNINKACVRICTWWHHPTSDDFDSRKQVRGDSIEIPLDPDTLRKIANSILEIAEGLENDKFESINNIYDKLE